MTSSTHYILDGRREATDHYRWRDAQTKRFENALQVAEARLATAGQDVGASTATVA